MFLELAQCHLKVSWESQWSPVQWFHLVVTNEKNKNRKCICNTAGKFKSTFFAEQFSESAAKVGTLNNTVHVKNLSHHGSELNLHL